MDKKNCDNGCCGSSKFDGFVDSIEEEIRSENWLSIWNKYGKLVSYAAIALLIAVGVYNVWQRQDMADREAMSHRFSIIQNAIMSEKPEQILPQLKEFSASAKEPYKTLSKLVYAANLRAKNDKSAVFQYKQLSEDENADKVFRDFAYIMYVSTSLDLMSVKEITRELDGFIDNLSKKHVGGPWDMIARETLAFCYIKYGKNDLAKEELIKLAKTQDVPQAMAERAKTLVNIIDLQS
ncbi:MAG: tetratricopeptide repeat protein [Holosporales bacterium]|jgi:hypothetical protein|nr:tetratricopeptide repeat protein [Holosporales bacterium]